MKRTQIPRLWRKYEKYSALAESHCFVVVIVKGHRRFVVDSSQEKKCEHNESQFKIICGKKGDLDFDNAKSSSFDDCIDDDDDEGGFNWIAKVQKLQLLP